MEPAIQIRLWIRFIDGIRASQRCYPFAGCVLKGDSIQLSGEDVLPGFLMELNF